MATEKYLSSGGAHVDMANSVRDGAALVEFLSTFALYFAKKR